MEYAEIPLPGLDDLAKTFWTLHGDGTAPAGVEHSATPDGCVEVIRRLHGRSTWGRAQPAVFVAGLIDRPALLHFSGDAAFVGLRLWPWTWHALGGRPCRSFLNDWIALDDAGLPGRTVALFHALDAGDADAIGAALDAAVAPADRAIGRAVVASASVADLARRSGRSMRGLQRWFQHAVGLPPRTYLRLLRFQDTLSAIQADATALADQAAHGGYADQAHMAREFRELAGAAARTVRKRARGPFV